MFVFFFFKQKTAYDMRISDWSSDVCSSDLTINLERLARVVATEERDGECWALPDTLIGTDSHTPMVGGIGVLGWGVGGLEAESAMLGAPVMLRVPEVVGVRLTGRLREGVTATDLALHVTHRLRQIRLVGRFAEFFGDRKSTRLNSFTNAHLVCRLLLEKKKSKPRLIRN